MSLLLCPSVPRNRSVLPLSLAAPLPEGRLQAPADLTSGVVASFHDLLCQEVMSALDANAVTKDEPETGLGLTPLTWDEVMAMTHPRAELPEPEPGGHQGAPRSAPTSLALSSNHLQAPPDLCHATAHQQASAGASARLLIAKSNAQAGPALEPGLPSPIPVEQPLSPAHSAAGFLEKLAGVAQTTAEALGLSAHLLLAQAALETGWGRKPIQDAQGQESYNLFGIKAGKGWAGKTIEVMTTECLDGITQKKVQSFRAYRTYAESFADYAKVIKHRYGDAMAKGATAQSFGRALQAKGYATDPSYALKIASVAQSVAHRLASTQV